MSDAPLPQITPRRLPWGSGFSQIHSGMPASAKEPSGGEPSRVGASTLAASTMEASGFEASTMEASTMEASTSVPLPPPHPPPTQANSASHPRIAPLLLHITQNPSR